MTRLGRVQTKNNFIFLSPLSVKFSFNAFFLPADPIEYSGHFQILISPVPSFIKLQAPFGLYLCPPLPAPGWGWEACRDCFFSLSSLQVHSPLHSLFMLSSAPSGRKVVGRSGLPSLTGTDVIQHQYSPCGEP